MSASTNMGKTDLTPAESASALLALVDGATFENSGRFVTHLGKEIPP